MMTSWRGSITSTMHSRESYKNRLMRSEPKDKFQGRGWISMHRFLLNPLLLLKILNISSVFLSCQNMNTTEAKQGLEILPANLTHIPGTEKVRKRKRERGGGGERIQKTKD